MHYKVHHSTLQFTAIKSAKFPQPHCLSACLLGSRMESAVLSLPASQEDVSNGPHRFFQRSRSQGGRWNKPLEIATGSMTLWLHWAPVRESYQLSYGSNPFAVSELRSLDSGSWILDSGSWILGSGSWILASGFRNLGASGLSDSCSVLHCTVLHRSVLYCTVVSLFLFCFFIVED